MICWISWELRIEPEVVKGGGFEGAGAGFEGVGVAFEGVEVWGAGEGGLGCCEELGIRCLGGIVVESRVRKSVV